MRKSVSALVILASCLVTMVTAKDAFLSATDAALKPGEMVWVEDVVQQVTVKPSGTVFLNFGQPFPKEALTAIVMSGTRERFPGIETWSGRRVTFSGKVTLYKGHARIILRERGQIVLAD